MIVVTLIRASGLRNGDVIDIVWETYWLFISAEVGLIMTAFAAFRSLFVAHASRDPHDARGAGSSWYDTCKRLVKRSLSPRSWRSESSTPISKESSQASGGANNLPDIPRGTMTGIRTWINGRDKGSVNASRMMRSELIEEEKDDDPGLLLSDRRDAPRICVQHDIICKSEETRSPYHERESARQHFHIFPGRSPHMSYSRPFEDRTGCRPGGMV